MTTRKITMMLMLTAIIFMATSCGDDDATADKLWQGPNITFTKADNTDWTLEENQDRITSNVWITRQNREGLFNIVEETEDLDLSACQGPEPSGTEWAYGTTADIASLTFQPLGPTVGCMMFSTIADGQDMVLHLIADDVYIDLKFTSWTNGGNGGTGANGGGGFSYERSTMD